MFLPSFYLVVTNRWLNDEKKEGGSCQKILTTLTLTGYLNFCRIVMDVKAKT
ncbi:hypothetical protein JCM18904_3071 [Vibrio sp. JCM 18904]|nr:hypothetical protein JCM18904_3071 [Vibrio sp. JCM 18904]